MRRFTTGDRAARPCSDRIVGRQRGFARVGAAHCAGGERNGRSEPGAMNRAPTTGGEPGPQVGGPDCGRARTTAPPPSSPPPAGWTIRPHPDDDEVAALVAVLAGRTGGDDQGDVAPRTNLSRWAMSGRRAALRGLSGAPANGWGRAERSDR